jgi:hypothetical protein
MIWRLLAVYDPQRSSGWDSFCALRCFAMAERKAAKKGTQRSAKGTTGKASKGFTDEERAAMRERARELKAAARARLGGGQGGRGERRAREDRRDAGI